MAETAAAQLSENPVSPSEVPLAPSGPVTPQPGDEGYEAYMVALGEGRIQPGETSSVEDRPEWLLNKFKTVEAQAQAYTELEKLMGRRSDQQQTPPASQSETAPQESSTDPLKITQTAEEAATPPAVDELDWDAIETEAVTNYGKLSEETTTKIKAMGIPQTYIDRQLFSIKQGLDQAATRANDMAGGEQQRMAVINWLRQNKTEVQQNELDIAMKSPTWEYTWQGLVNEYSQAVPNTTTEPAVIQGQPAVAGSASFQTQTEMVEAIKDPRYRNDPAYREQVQQRIYLTDGNTMHNL